MQEFNAWGFKVRNIVGDGNFEHIWKTMTGAGIFERHDSETERY